MLKTTDISMHGKKYFYTEKYMYNFAEVLGEVEDRFPEISILFNPCQNVYPCQQDM